MPAPAPAKESPSKNLSLEERIQRRAYELYVQRDNQSLRICVQCLERALLHESSQNNKA